MNARSTFALAVVVGFAFSFVNVSSALAVKASPSTCAYGGKTCMVCAEFEVVTRKGKKPKRNCVKCVPDQANAECVDGQYCPNGKDKNGICFF